MAEKKDDRLNVRMPTADIAELNSIHQKLGIPPAEFVRKLTESALAFYRTHGFFSFPVRIEPEEDFIWRTIQYKSQTNLEGAKKEQSDTAKKKGR